MKKLSIIFLAAVAVASTCFWAFASGDNPDGKVIAYYFHGTMRCPTCHNLEQYSKEALETNFKGALASGKLEFKVVNVEERANEHYAGDYQLYTKSLVLSRVKDGKQIKWKNLDKIWEHVRNKQKFIDYVKAEVGIFLKEAQ